MGRKWNRRDEHIKIEIKEIINSKDILKTLEKWFILIDENITEMPF